jgi:hypothetical protein
MTVQHVLLTHLLGHDVRVEKLPEACIAADSPLFFQSSAQRRPGRGSEQVAQADRQRQVVAEIHVLSKDLRAVLIEAHDQARHDVDAVGVELGHVLAHVGLEVLQLLRAPEGVLVGALDPDVGEDEPGASHQLE